MTRYEKLGVSAVRWLGVVLLSLSVTLLLATSSRLDARLRAR